MAYAYYGESGFLYVVDHLGLAVDNTTGIVVETDIPNQSGYPLVDGKLIIFDSKTAKCHYNDENGLKQPIETPKEIEELVEKIFMNEYKLADEHSSPPLP